MAPPVVGQRRLLRRLRDLMAGGGSAQERLDQTVRAIAADMVAEVCSIYVMRSGQVLELFATQGLKQEAVHKTRLMVGEGLVGEIARQARPVALSDAQSHPLFAYRPETGEEIFHSLMGVPILRGGRVQGVLVIQNRTFREYEEEEVETLQTIAMVLAELVAGANLDSAGPQDGHAATAMPTRLEGVRLNEGIAIGRVVLHRSRTAVRSLVADDPKAERERLRAAVGTMHDALDAMLARVDHLPAGEHREVLETYRMFAEDRGWLGRIAEAIGTGLTAEAAVVRVQDDNRARMSQVADPYIRERLADLDDLANRLLEHLAGGDGSPRMDLPADAVLVARSLGPAELLDYDRARLKAVVMAEGGPTSHAAIVARALDLPMVGRVEAILLEAEPGDPVIVDGDHGQVFLRPGEEAREAFERATRDRAARAAGYAQLRDLPAVTRDGVRISLNLNAGLLIDLAQLGPSGAEGIGLYRTEIPFMVRARFPSVPEQIALYRRALDLAGDRRVVFRTLDIGGDKLLPYQASAGEENPAMGWRAIRIALDRPSILRGQLRALIAASAGRPLDLMFPMVAETAELVAARRLIDLELARAGRRGSALPTEIRVGTMLEVPALAFEMPRLLDAVDFLSIGSNDLMQFLFAADRGNPHLAERYDPLSPAMLALIRGVVAAAAARGVPVALCGDMAARPLEAMALLGAGLRTLSMPGGAVGPVKAMIRSLDLGALERFMTGLVLGPESRLRGHLAAYARDHAVAV